MRKGINCKYHQMEYYKYYISTNTILTDTQQTVPYTRDPAPSGCYVRPTTTTVTCREDKVPYIFFALLASFTKKALCPFHNWGLLPLLGVFIHCIGPLGLILSTGVEWVLGPQLPVQPPDPVMLLADPLAVLQGFATQ